MADYQEKNRKTLLKAVQFLPDYPAPKQIWDRIEPQLEQQDRLHTAVRELPRYNAPRKVWEQIEKTLDRQPRRPAIYRRILRVSSWGVAAMVAGLACCIWWIVSSEPAAVTTIAYTQEVLAAPAADADWQAEDQTFEMVIQQINSSPILEEGAVKRLKLEYTELTDARKEVEGMLGRYGNDTSLLQEIARIERERSRVIKQLATWI